MMDNERMTLRALVLILQGLSLLIHGGKKTDKWDRDVNAFINWVYRK